MFFFFYYYYYNVMEIMIVLMHITLNFYKNMKYILPIYLKNIFIFIYKNYLRS